MYVPTMYLLVAIGKARHNFKKKASSIGCTLGALHIVLRLKRLHLLAGTGVRKNHSEHVGSALLKSIFLTIQKV